MREAVTNHPFPLRAFLTVVRWPNMLMLMCIQTLVFFTASGEHVVILLLVTGMTLCITAAGYIHNDLADQETDRRNRRRNVFAAGYISLDRGLLSMRICALIGLCFALILSVVSTWLFLVVYGFIAFLLWLYTPYLKGIPVAGNITVSILCALAVLIVCFPASPISGVPQQVLLLSMFAFQVTFIREVVKDIEDLEGDVHGGYVTLPVILGIKATKWIIAGLTALTVVGLVLSAVYLNGFHWFSLTWIGITSILLMAAGIVFIAMAQESHHFHRISTLFKISMLTGTLGIIF